jgi:hypothetical protein
MKKILLIIITTLFCNIGFAQDVEYFILTTQTGTGISEGITKTQTPKRNSENYGSIHIALISHNREFRLSFIHVNYNLTELTKIRQPRSDDQMEITTITQSVINSLNPIDLDVLFPTMTKQQAQEFYDSKRGKKIYIIDRSTKSRRLDTYTMYEVRNAIPPKF